ncbi:cytochrome c3 family protein [Mucilaginibacter sp. KACC 22063]|uniref:cytochrome c3 family protein n=1 Tax=Mucilaginibacter sp. KACC 22063 TaxID=3025666 RepID=UPI0023658E49|nr:cytochrome c3 family protein [Mucilaginibacter sp. KACC 22063]WDF54427.1 cytochrome c3 family protein [Mucilaginibacter sp. KACC 22063]
MKTKRFYFFILLLFPLTVFISQCLTPAKQDPRDAVFAGSDKCQKCHKDVYDSYVHTAHFNSSRLATSQTVHGSFTNNHTFSFGNNQVVAMEKRDSGLYQVYYVNGKQKEAHRFDITFGGKKAETYLSWNGNQLFQLPMSYFTALNSWTNSPGYRTDRPDFERPILRRCFECHSSYIKELPQQSIDMQHRVVAFDKSSLILGIDCERCHGPAANHVNYHTEFPNEKKAKYINTYASLTRSQKLDACAVCHASNKEAFMVTSFKFKMGDTLSKFKEPNFLPENPDPDKLDVHGNQSGLLATSKCFIKSSMDCGSCHNPHTNQKLDLAAYSQKCMNCHSNANHNFCPMESKLGVAIKQNCIDCHMPLKPSNVIEVEASGGKKVVPYLVRTHHIAIYPKKL